MRAITEREHLDFIRTRRSASFLQTPAWGQVKSEWRRESLGWFRDASSTRSSTSTQGLRDGSLVGVALVLYRRLPRVKRSLAYLPEGPVIDWDDTDLGAWLTPMTAHLKRQGAFGSGWARRSSPVAGAPHR